MCPFRAEAERSMPWESARERGNPSSLVTVQGGRLAGFIWGANNQARAVSAGGSLQQHLGTVSGEEAREMYFFRSWQCSFPAPIAGMQHFPRPRHLLSAGKAQGAFCSFGPGQVVSNRTVRRAEGRLPPSRGYGAGSPILPSVILATAMPCHVPPERFIAAARRHWLFRSNRRSTFPHSPPPFENCQ